jgi:ferredoxin-like protein FixX
MIISHKNIQQLNKTAFDSKLLDKSTNEIWTDENGFTWKRISSKTKIRIYERKQPKMCPELCPNCGKSYNSKETPLVMRYNQCLNCQIEKEHQELINK